MARQPIDKNRVKLTELLEELGDRLGNMRDYAMVPGNSWLAKGELGTIAQLTSELEGVLEDIKEADSENGY